MTDQEARDLVDAGRGHLLTEEEIFYLADIKRKSASPLTKETAPAII